LVSPSAFGLISLATAYIAILELFLDQGFGQFIIYYDKIDDIHLNTVFWIVLSTSFFLMGISILTSGFIASFYSEPHLENVIDVLSISLVISSFASVPKTILRKQLSFKLLAYRGIIANFISGVIALILAFRGFGVWSLVGLTLSYRLMEVILLWAVTDWIPQFQFSFSKVKQMLSFGMSSMTVKVLKLADRRIDDLLIGYFLGSQVLGYYTIAYKLVRMAVTLFTGVLTTVAFPLFSKLKNNTRKLKYTYEKLSEYSSLFLWPLFIYLAIFSEFIILIFGEKWYSAHETMAFLALGSMLYSTVQLNGSLAWGMGRHKLNLKYSAIITFVQSLLFYFTSQVSIEAVAIAYLISNTFLFVPLQLNLGIEILNYDIRSIFLVFKKPIIFTILFSISSVITYWLLSVSNIQYFYILALSCLFLLSYYSLLMFIYHKDIISIIKSK
jgi:PST family polysaccharide transporter